MKKPTTAQRLANELRRLAKDHGRRELIDRAHPSIRPEHLWAHRTAARLLRAEAARLAREDRKKRRGGR